VFDHRNPLIVHLYFKPHTAAMRYVNVRADRTVGDEIDKVLSKRYAPMTYKIEFYGRDARFGFTAMCLVITEGPFSKGAKYRDTTVKEVNDMLELIEEG